MIKKGEGWRVVLHINANYLIIIGAGLGESPAQNAEKIRYILYLIG
jgi:hypothetical protein